MTLEEKLRQLLAKHKANSFINGYWGCSCGFRYEILLSRENEFSEHINEIVSNFIYELQARAYDKGYSKGNYDGIWHYQYGLHSRGRAEKSRRNPYRYQIQRKVKN